MSNFIKERNINMTYLELRILTYLECEEKIKKITQILNFLQGNDFLVNLTILYHSAMRSENIYEQQNISSLTIDMRDDKFRFKFWNGSKIYWTYHTNDLFDILLEGRKDFNYLVDKYQNVTELLMETIREQYNQYINRITYTYYPSSDVEVLYEIQFKKKVEKENLTDILLKDIFNYINQLNVEDLKMNLDYSFEKECLPCQKAREKRENERKNMEG